MNGGNDVWGTNEEVESERAGEKSSNRLLKRVSLRWLRCAIP